MQLPKLLELVLLVESIAASIISGVIDEQHVLSDSRPGIGLVNDDPSTRFELIKHANFPDHTLRITEPKPFCDSVKQYSGYLDVKPSGKHFFFWYFQARHDPEKAPLVMWVNGGPGCSGTIGLLWELGPCRVQPGGNTTKPHPHSWTEHANMIFLDEPVQTGFSYSDAGFPSTPMNAAAAAEDAYAFLQVFFARFPELGRMPFHLAGESWGGQFVPHLAAVIHKQNLAIATQDQKQKQDRHDEPHIRNQSSNEAKVKINLHSILMGNGITDGLRQFPTLARYLCKGPYALFDFSSKECGDLDRMAERCEKMVRACYKYDSSIICGPAEQVCLKMLDPVLAAKLNYHDIRKPCKYEYRDKGICYSEMHDQETFLNKPDVQASLGVGPPDRPHVKFQACNDRVLYAHRVQGGDVRDTVHLVPELIRAGIRMLAYAGNADAAINYMGVESFVEHLGSAFREEFGQAERRMWVAGNRTAGYVRAWGGDGGTAGNLTFVAVYEAGHMAPFDQPEATLDMFRKWINDEPIHT